MDHFLTSNSTGMRLARTIVQGLFSVLVTYVPDLIAGTETIPTAYKPILVATIMAILSPIMAEFGRNEDINE